MSATQIESFSNFFINEVLTKGEVLSSTIEAASQQYYNVQKILGTSAADKVISEITKSSFDSPHFSKDLTKIKLKEIFQAPSSPNELSKKLKSNLSLTIKNNSVTPNVSKREARILTSWGNIKNLFRDRVDFCVIKEAIGWIHCYINSPDFSKSEISYLDGRTINLEKTLKTITKRINDLSLTEDPPFEFRNGKMTFTPAKTGEIDVALWSEADQKIIGSSITRDRSTVIEGNQFFRHWLRVHNVSKKIRAENENLTAEDVRQKLSETGNDLSEHHNDGGDFNYNWLKAKGDQEEYSLPLLLAEMKESSKYVFFGEIFSKYGAKFFNENSRRAISNINIKEITDTEKDSLLLALDLDYNSVSAGLNSLSYNRNFTTIGNVKFSERESRLIKSSLDIRYNGIDFDQNVELEAKKVVLLALVSGSDLFKMVRDQFSEGVSYREERSNFINSINNFLTEYMEYETDLEKSAFTQEYFSGVDKKMAEEVLSKIESKSGLDCLKRNIESIEVAQSEVPTYIESALNRINLMREKIDKKEVAELLKRLESEKPSADDLSRIKKLLK